MLITKNTFANLEGKFSQNFSQKGLLLYNFVSFLKKVWLFHNVLFSGYDIYSNKTAEIGSRLFLLTFCTNLKKCYTSGGLILCPEYDSISASTSDLDPSQKKQPRNFFCLDSPSFAQTVLHTASRLINSK